MFSSCRQSFSTYASIYFVLIILLASWITKNFWSLSFKFLILILILFLFLLIKFFFFLSYFLSFLRLLSSFLGQILVKTNVLLRFLNLWKITVNLFFLSSLLFLTFNNFNGPPIVFLKVLMMLILHVQALTIWKWL